LLIFASVELYRLLQASSVGFRVLEILPRLITRSLPGVTYRTHDSNAEEELSASRDDARFASRILIVSLLIGICCGSALVWRWSFGFGAIPAASTTTIGAAVGKPAWQGDLAALQQEMAQSAQASQQLLAAQEAEIRRLSDQVVALSSKLEQLPAPPASTSVGAAVDTPTWQGDLAALRREMMQSAQTSHQLGGAQDAQLRLLSDQVAALSNKLELLHPMTAAQAAMPEPIPTPAGALAPAAVRKSAIPLPKKRPEVPNPIAAEPVDTHASQPAETQPQTARKLRPRLWL
jgi:hypothetical protein